MTTDAATATESQSSDLDRLDSVSRDMFRLAFESDATEDRRTTLRLACAEVSLARALESISDRCAGSVK